MYSVYTDSQKCPKVGMYNSKYPKIRWKDKEYFRLFDQ